MKQELSPMIRARTDIFDEYWRLYLEFSIVKHDRWPLHHEVMEEILDYVHYQAWNHYTWSVKTLLARAKAERRKETDLQGYDDFLKIIDSMKEAQIDLMVQFVESIGSLTVYGFLLMEEEALVNQLKKLLVPTTTTKCDHCARKAAIICPVCKQYLCARHYGAFWAVMKHGACTYCKRTNRMPSKLKRFMNTAIQIEDEDGNVDYLRGGTLRMVSTSAHGNRDLSEAFVYVEKYFRLLYVRLSPPLLIELKENINNRVMGLMQIIDEQFS